MTSTLSQLVTIGLAAGIALVVMWCGLILALTF